MSFDPYIETDADGTTWLVTPLKLDDDGAVDLESLDDDQLVRRGPPGFAELMTLAPEAVKCLPMTAAQMRPLTPAEIAWCKQIAEEIE